MSIFHDSVGLATNLHPTYVETPEMFLDPVSTTSTVRVELHRIHPKLKERHLIRYFSYFGEVANATILRNQDSSEDASGVIVFSGKYKPELLLMEHRIKGKEIYVSVPQQQQEAFNSDRCISRGQIPLSKSTLFVRDLHREVNNYELAAYFGHFGEVTDSKVVVNPHIGLSKGFGFVTFKKKRILKYVLNCGYPLEIKGRQIYVEQAREKKEFSGIENKYPQTDSYHMETHKHSHPQPNIVKYPFESYQNEDQEAHIQMEDLRFANDEITRTPNSILHSQNPRNKQIKKKRKRGHQQTHFVRKYYYGPPALIFGPFEVEENWDYFNPQFIAPEAYAENQALPENNQINLDAFHHVSNCTKQPSAYFEQESPKEGSYRFDDQEAHYFEGVRDSRHNKKKAKFWDEYDKEYSFNLNSEDNTIAQLKTRNIQENAQFKDNLDLAKEMSDELFFEPNQNVLDNEMYVNDSYYNHQLQ